jgi:hypothetical protein
MLVDLRIYDSISLLELVSLFENFVDNVKGCTSYQSIKTFNSKICKTFQKAGSELGFLRYDREF